VPSLAKLACRYGSVTRLAPAMPLGPIRHNTNKPVRPSKGVPGSGVDVGKLLPPAEIVPLPFAPCDLIKISLSTVISDTGANETSAGTR
jgi:hypothetical protein